MTAYPKSILTILTLTIMTTYVRKKKSLNREGSAYYFLAIHDVNAARKPI